MLRLGAGRKRGDFFLVRRPAEPPCPRDLLTIYQCFADETRLRILNLLFRRPLYVGQLEDATGLHQPLISRHLARICAAMAWCAPAAGRPACCMSGCSRHPQILLINRHAPSALLHALEVRLQFRRQLLRE